MTILQSRDVEISMIDEAGFLINTTQDSYKTVRACLSVLQEQQGLPLDYASEDLGTEMAAMSRMLVGKIPPFIIEDEEGKIPPRYENKFVIPGYKHQKVGKSKEKMMELVHEVANKLKSLYLQVEINTTNEREEKSGHLDNEVILVFEVAMSLVLNHFKILDKEESLWQNIPASVRKTLVKRDIEEFKSLVRNINILKTGISELSQGLGLRVDEKITKFGESKFRLLFFSNREEALKKIEIIPDREAKGVLQLLNFHYCNK